MSRRTEKVASLIRRVISQGIATKLSDPRISPFTSVTRVEVSGDLMHAAVYVSVMGTEADERTTMAGLQRARGVLQSLLARKLTTRHCPQLRFVVDRGIKKQMETLELIDRISEELRESEAARQSTGAEGAADRRDAETSPGEGP